MDGGRALRTVAVVSRRWHPWRGAREIGIFAAGYLVYFGVRAITEGSVASAIANARWLDDVEQALGFAWERELQAAVVGHDLLVRLANWVYMFGHWPLLIVAGVLLYNMRRGEYYVLRNTCLLSGAVGLVIFGAFPVAPPRLADLGFIDTVTVHAEGYRSVLPPSLVNEYAAMPSFHAGWNLLLGIVIFRATTLWPLRVFAVLMPLAMAVAVVVTANHFIIDVIIGSAIVLACLWVVLWDQRRRVPTLKDHAGPRDDRACAQDGAPGLAALPHRPSGGQRPAAAPERRAVRHPAGRV